MGSPSESKLALWAAQPVGQANRRAVLGSASAMTFVFLASSGAPHRADSIHSVAILLIGVHGFLHVWLLRWLTRQAAMGIAAAVAALAAFRDPRRISHIDLGVAWALLATLAPLAGLG